jgi:hypothetical protein
MPNPPPTPRSGRARRLVRAGMILGAIVLLAFLITIKSRHHGSGPAGSSPTSAPAAAPTAGRSPGGPGGEPARLPSQPEHVVLRENAAELMRSTLKHYLDYAVYPPWSRPYGEAYARHVSWNAPIEENIPAHLRDDKNEPVSGVLVLDRLLARRGEPMRATYTAWRGARTSPQRRIDLSVTGLVQRYDPALAARAPEDRSGIEPGWYAVRPLEFTRVEGAPNSYTATFVPSEIPALAAELSRARVVAQVNIRGPDQQYVTIPYTMSFDYVVEQPVVIVRKVSDAIVDGSLKVTFEADVKQALNNAVYATLFAADGTTPIAVFEGYFRPKKTGLQPLTVEFFGRVLHESKRDGPYVVGAFHGHSALPGLKEPGKADWADDNTYRTKAYQATDFSAAEWKSPEKDAQIRLYEDNIHKFRQGLL